MNEISHNYPRISVIIPAYNSENTIKATIDSVLNQTFADFELIVINDGSTDSTLDIVSQIQDSRLKVFSFENAGGNVSRNRGLQKSVGEFVSFLDADDIWTHHKLASQLKALQNNVDAKVAYSWTDYIGENGKFLVAGNHVTVDGDVYERLLVSNFLENGSNPLICRDILLELGGFDESLVAAQDWDMWLRLAAKYAFICVPEVQILYRVSANSLSSNLARQEKACLAVLERAYYARPLVSKNIWNLSLTNLYKYLVCKALQKPFNRQKGIVAAKFLALFFIHDYSRFKRGNFTVKLLSKIVLMVVLPVNLSTLLLTKEDTKTTKTLPLLSS
ncbi:glycosyltransferase [Fortiea sp. LEGE XX443]|uniref:glycosyltransferase n=1 Tax=Fortiea sp. LEGE XX443 TaxID=1828611 RepID=UPI00187DF7A7|nr:glycosyltransferase [Fortiea sp. LEGE XX443]MBE9004022.1 glycosyltransferase [Fortiea sp. LEGE XX443]